MKPEIARWEIHEVRNLMFMKPGPWTSVDSRNGFIEAGRLSRIIFAVSCGFCFNFRDNESALLHW